MPVAPDDIKIEEFDCAIADPHGVGLPLVNFLTMDEIVPELILGNPVGIFAMVKLD